MHDSKTQMHVLIGLQDALSKALGALDGLILDCGNPVTLMIYRDALGLMKNGLLHIAKTDGLIV